MKRNILIIILCCLFSITLFAQNKNMEKIIAATEALRLAMISGDSVQLTKLTLDSLSYGHSGGHIETQKEFINKISSGASDFITIDITNQTIKIYNNTAIVRHSLNATTNDNGKAGAVKLFVLQVWIKEKAEWKLAARQAVKQP
jgi:Domain of unknown function (DUF4440)